MKFPEHRITRNYGLHLRLIHRPLGSIKTPLGWIKPISTLQTRAIMENSTVLKGDPIGCLKPIRDRLSGLPYGFKAAHGRPFGFKTAALRV